MRKYFKRNALTIAIIQTLRLLCDIYLIKVERQNKNAVRLIISDYSIVIFCQILRYFQQ